MWGVLLIVLTVCWMPFFSDLVCLLKRRGRVASSPSAGRIPRLLFLVPAHNEELLISTCVRSLLSMSYPAVARAVVVIADNCSDATARLARDYDVTVLERSEPELAGKPHAIAWALQQMHLKEWDAIVIVDADSVVAPDFAAGLAALGKLNDLVFQPNNLVLNELETWLTRLGGLLGRSMFQVRYPLKQSAGLNCPIANGMGIGTNILIRYGWQSVSVTEDSELYVVYTEAGVPIRHASKANIYSQESRSLADAGIQRRRWLAGRIRIVREWGLRVMRSPCIGWHQKLDIFVEIALSNPVLHFIAATFAAFLSILLLPGRGGNFLALLSVLSLCGRLIETIIALVRHPQPWRTVFAFVMLPVYAVWRIWVAAATLLTLQDGTWQRSARVGARPPLVKPTL